ncbi:MAG: hypothetical protein V3U02_08125 [Calditrichia bacterium]
MFKKAIITVLKNQGRTKTWLAKKCGLKVPSLCKGLEDGHNLSVPATEKCFEALGITLNIPE